MVCPFPLILYFLHPNPSVPAIQQNLLLLTKWHSVSLTCCVAATVVSAPYPQTTAVQELPPSQKERFTGLFFNPLHDPFLESGCVKSGTLSWARISLPHRGCEAQTLWWVLSVSLLIPSIWHHPIPSAICWHILWNCQNTLEIVQNWVQAATAWQKDAAAPNGGAWFFLIYVTPFNHHS